MKRSAITLLVEGKTQIDRDLPMGYFAIFNMAARFDYLEPTKVMDRFRSFLKRSPYGLVTSRRGAASDLNSLEYFRMHYFPPTTRGECKYTRRV